MQCIIASAAQVMYEYHAPFRCTLFKRSFCVYDWGHLSGDQIAVSVIRGVLPARAEMSLEILISQL